jgi:hypothetical protein
VRCTSKLGKRLALTCVNRVIGVAARRAPVPHGSGTPSRATSCSACTPGPYLDLMGGDFEVAFEHEHHILDLGLLSWLSSEQLRTWLDLAWGGLRMWAGPSAGTRTPPKRCTRPAGSISATYLCGTSGFWPGSAGRGSSLPDLPPYFDFIISVQQKVEQRVPQRLAQEPTAG